MSKVIDQTREIFLAQHYGNVSPEEYMVPYPNIPELLTGQNIKHGKKIVYSDQNITNGDLLERSGKYANWLLNQDVGFGDRVYVSEVESVDAVALAFAIWRTGAVLVIGEFPTQIELDIKLIIDKETMPESEDLEAFEPEVSIPETQSLNDEALIIIQKNNAVVLTHYNLLVNTVGIQQVLALDETSSVSVKTGTWSLPWVILYVIMPLTSGASIGEDQASLTRISSSNDMNCDYRIIEDWQDFSDTKPEGIFFLHEAGGALTIGSQPVPLLKVRKQDKTLYVQGHSVMKGYTSNTLNAKAFKDGWLNLSLT